MLRLLSLFYKAVRLKIQRSDHCPGYWRFTWVGGCGEDAGRVVHLHGQTEASSVGGAVPHHKGSWLFILDQGFSWNQSTTFTNVCLLLFVVLDLNNDPTTLDPGRWNDLRKALVYSEILTFCSADMRTEPKFGIVHDEFHGGLTTIKTGLDTWATNETRHGVKYWKK